MTKIASVIAAYLKNGDAEVMSKIEMYLTQNLKIDNKNIKDV